MTTTLAASPHVRVDACEMASSDAAMSAGSACAHESAGGEKAARVTNRCVLRISCMPSHLRLRVEGLMHEHLSEPEVAPSLVSVWDVPWFTRWRREPSRAGTVSCREVIEAPEEELATLRAALTEVGETFGFEVSVD